MSNDRLARLPSLTGVRSVLGLTTLLCHALYLFFPRSALSSPAVQIVMLLARIDVTCFFVLSGFVLTWSASIWHNATSFWRRRALKIVPTHVLAWTIGMAFILLTGVRPPFSTGGQQITPTDLWCLLLLSGWWPAQHDGGPNPAMWSVTCEVFFYALFPVLLPALHRLSHRGLKRTWLTIAATIVLVPLPASLIPGPPLTESLSVSYVTLWACFVLPLTRSLEFVLGMTTARLLQTGQWPQAIPKKLSLGLLVPMFALLPVLPPQYALGPLFAMHACALIVAIARTDINNRPGVLSRPAAVLVGDASYALYILHFPLLLIAVTAIGPVGGGLQAFVVMVTCMAAMQLVAVLVSMRIEKPLIRRYSSLTRVRPLPSG